MATKRKLKADGTTGKVAVYIVDDTAIDDSPFTAPLSNLSRVEFHSDLDYLQIQPIGGNLIKTGTLALPSHSGTSPGTYRHNLFAHGLGYQPLVIGHLVNFEGYNTPLLGTTPIRTPMDRTLAATRADMRTVQLGADSTNVYLHEYMLLVSTSLTYPAVDLDWRVMVTTRNMDSSTGNDNTASHPSNLYISGSRVVFGRGKFDTDRSHIKKVSTGGFPVCIGPSLRVYQEPATDYTINWKWNVNGQAKGSFSGVSFTATVDNMDAI
jgi:hypothetical protein